MSYIGIIGISFVMLWILKYFRKKTYLENVFQGVINKFNLNDIIEYAKIKEFSDDNFVICEIEMKYMGRRYIKYLKLVEDEAIVSRRSLAGPHDELQTLGNVELLFLLFFERHLDTVRRDIADYRKSKYKWNIGTLSYLAIQQPNKVEPS